MEDKLRPKTLHDVIMRLQHETRKPLKVSYLLIVIFVLLFSVRMDIKNKTDLFLDV